MFLAMYSNPHQTCRLESGRPKDFKPPRLQFPAPAQVDRLLRLAISQHNSTRRAQHKAASPLQSVHGNDTCHGLLEHEFPTAHLSKSLLSGRARDLAFARKPLRVFFSRGTEKRHQPVSLAAV
jgi:hypothetical protein